MYCMILVKLTMSLLLSVYTWNVQVVGFVPTGWMYEMKRKAFPVREKGPCFIHLVPYSEHSSYSELREYVRFLRPHKVSHLLHLGI